MMKWHPIYRRQHEADDSKPKDYCCYKSNLCHLYRELRPVERRCSRFFFFIFVIFWGDPHIMTLDQKQFTFNGQGEFWMLKSDDDSFRLQARTARATNSQGEQTQATIFSAFAAKDDTDSWVHVQLSTDKQSLVVKAYGGSETRDETGAFYAVPEYLKQLGNITLTRNNQTLTASFTKSQISMDVTLGIGMLSVSVSMPDNLKNTSNFRGLMGNFDGNPENDFIFPNGTVLPGDTTEKNLFHYGQTWAIDAAESILVYPTGKNSTNFQVPSFVPLFLEDFTQEQINNGKEICGNDTNCLFDFLATGREDVARSTLQTESDTVAEQAEAANEVPSLDGNTTISVEVSHPITFQLNATDDGTVTYQVDEEVEGLTLNTATGSVTWTPANTNPVNVSFTAVDNQGVSSPVLEVEVLMCSGCSAHGTCNYIILQDEETTTSFRRATCVCNVGWEGDDCESDIDGCADSPCAIGTNCTDVAAASQAVGSPGYTCTDCPAGYAVSGTKCEDVDECLNVTLFSCPTGSSCLNVEGSYQCPCNSGFRKIGEVCVDIDECIEESDNCQQNCANTDGNFTCSCYPQYTLNATNAGQCDAPAGATNCSLSNLTCQHVCNGDVCACDSGYELDGIENCKDIDECDGNLCSQNCANSVGSFQCSCIDGYKLDGDGVTCNLCEQSVSYGVECAKSCGRCGVGSKECNPTQGCVCDGPGWTGETCETNINECNTAGACTGDHQVCVDTPGSYSCDCETGYVKLADGSCTDFDECADAADNECDETTQTCVNIQGNYTCRCQSGYTEQDPFKCQDIDECALKIDVCNHRCINKAGDYDCNCEFGFDFLDTLRRTCHKIEDPCAEIFNLNCTHFCILDANNNDATCGCNKGYFLGDNAQTCLDVIECENATLNTCGQPTNCANTVGSFTCGCNIGHSLNNDGRACDVCDEYHWGENCATECRCGAGASTCNPISGCECSSEGWTGTLCDQDKNECQSGVASCRVKSDCVNTPGTYECRCWTGYLLNVTTDACEDIDECSEDRLPCAQICTNTEGSYQCHCKAGFLLDGTSCNDIDECAIGQHQCAHTCYNNEGSFYCACREGFALNNTDRQSCIVTDACTVRTCDATNGGCSKKSDGSEDCFCNTGFRLNVTDNATCDNIDECTENNPCSDSAICEDTSPGFYCNCSNGYQISADTVTCQECVEGKYSFQCGQTCSCVSDGTLSCNKTNGHCTCKPGFTGTTCADDINECTGTEVLCPALSVCVNNIGSYRCACSVGFAGTGTGADFRCVACDDSHYGSECALQCACNATNTVACVKTNGTCNCKSGWKGTTCDDDIDECTTTAGICGANVDCINTPGSHTCACHLGYGPNADGNCEACRDFYYGRNCVQICGCAQANTLTCEKTTGVCNCRPGFELDDCSQDIDECLDTSLFDCNRAHTECSNTPGNYKCVCMPGYYTNSSGDCVPCEVPFMYGRDCRQNCPCNQTNSMSCYHVNGSCTCNSVWEGENCTTDINECTLQTHNCSTQNNTKCQNTPGGYECACIEGYAKNADGECVDLDECSPPGPPICGGRAECRNTIGSYTCHCKAGFRGFNTNCTALTIPNPGVGHRIFSAFARFNLSVSIALNDPDSAEYAAMVDLVNTTLTLYFKAQIGDKLIEIHIRRIWEGSLYVDYLTTTSDDTAAVQAYVLATENLLDDDTVVYIGDDPASVKELLTTNTAGDIVSIPSGTTDEQICSIYVTYILCNADSQECAVINNVPQCRPKRTEDNFALVVGLGVGLPLAFIAAFIIVVVIISYKKYQERKRSLSSEMDRTSIQDGFFPSVMPTKFDSWGRTGPYYQWDRDNGSSSSDDDRKGRSRHRRENFDDMHHGGAYDNAPGFFSWDFIYNYSGMKPGNKYEIRRPHVIPRPQEIYQKQKDSAA